MTVGYGDCQRIGGIGLWVCGELQQRAHHVLHLAFLRATISYHRLLNLSCCVFEHRKILVYGRNNCHATRLAKLQRRIGVFRHKDLLDSEIVRLKLGNNLGHACVDQLKT